MPSQEGDGSDQGSHVNDLAITRASGEGSANENMMAAQLALMAERQEQFMKNMMQMMMKMQGMSTTSVEMPDERAKLEETLEEEEAKKLDELLKESDDDIPKYKEPQIEKVMPKDLKEESNEVKVQAVSMNESRTKISKNIDQMTRSIGESIPLMHIADWVTEYKTLIEVQISLVVQNVNENLSNEVQYILDKNVDVDKLSWEIGEIVRVTLGKIKVKEKESNNLFLEFYQGVTKDPRYLDCKNKEIQRMRLMDEEIQKWMRDNSKAYLRKLDEIIFNPKRETYGEFMKRYLRIVNVAYPGNTISEGNESNLIDNLFKRTHRRSLRNPEMQLSTFLQNTFEYKRRPNIMDALNHIKRIYDVEPPATVMNSYVRHEIKRVNFKGKRTVKCYRCGKLGHISRDCKETAHVKKKEKAVKTEAKAKPVEIPVVKQVKPE